jgi:4-amino-4-deoxy-L-arabinose transferase-like glycosyltransferase
MLDRRRDALPLAIILLLGGLLRALTWGEIPRTGLISDEGEYLSAATWLAQGRGFSWYQHYLWTRAPIYPLFLALHLRLFGDDPAPIYLSQHLLSLANVLLTYALARRMLPMAHRVMPLLAALLMAIYFPFVIYPQALLSETLFLTLLLSALLALAAAAERRTLPPLLLAGALLGVATLTRSLTLFFIPLAALWLAFYSQPAETLRRRLLHAMTLLLCSAAVIAPWTLYNSRFYGGLVVIDTSGGYNLLLGAWTAHDGVRRDAPTRDFVLGLFPEQAQAPAATCAPYPGPLTAQADRQAAMTREGLCLIADRPLAFIQKSLAELVDLFQINYTGAERFTAGFTTGRLPPWYVAALFLLDDTIYVATLTLAALGWGLARRTMAPIGSLAGIWWLYNIAVAPLLFAINRFRLPLLPFAFIFAAFAIIALAGRIKRSRASEQRTIAVKHRHYQTLCATLALALCTAAAAPYAYLRPNAQSLPSYLGPYPSSLLSSQLALAARPRYERTEQLRAALRIGDAPTATQLLATNDLTTEAQRVAPALLAALEGRYADGIALLPDPAEIDQNGDAVAAVVRGDLLRSMGEEAAARAAFTPRYVDSANPVEWAWEWLRPAPTSRIDLGGNLDLGYIAGCYLGEGDPAAGGTFRWCTSGAQLRFPAAAAAAERTLALRVDGRGWAGYTTTPPQVNVLVGGVVAGSFTLDLAAPQEVTLPLPPGDPGADVIITLRGPTFIPDARRYLSQQGEQVGQVHRLALRLDWVEIREKMP